MAINLFFNVRQLYSALRGGKSLSRCPPSLISTNMLKRRAQSLLFPSSLTVSTNQQAEYTQRAVMHWEETDLSDIPIYVSSILHYTNKPTDHEAIAQARQKIQNEPLHLSKEPKMIGNTAGFDMFREFRAMNKRLDDLNVEVKSLKDDKELSGVNELISRSRFSDLYIDVLKARNEATHGADIKFHRKLLDLPSLDKGKRLACMEGFESTYRLSPAVYDSHFREAPSSIIEIANLRGYLYYLPDYTKSSHHKAEIRAMQKICDEILSLWVSQNAATISEELRAMIANAGQLHWMWQEEEDNWEPPEEEN